MVDNQLLKSTYFEDILKILDNNTNLSELKHELECLSKQLLCGAFSVELKIMYDGTIISCQNHMFGLNEENIKNDNSVENQVKKYLIKKNYYMNPLSNDFKLEDFENWREAFIIGKTDSYLYTFQQTIALMYYLSLAKQIDPSYIYNFKKLVLHAFILTPVRQCPYNLYITTGSLYNKDTGFLRWYCNGMMDEVENFMNLQREKGAILNGI